MTPKTNPEAKPVVDWEWIYAEMVDPGVEHPPTVTSVFDGKHDTGPLRSGPGEDKP